MPASGPLTDLAPAILDFDQPTAVQIHAGLRAAILSLVLPPGTRVSEAEAGARFGASRTPVREAMTRLRDEGLIVTWPSRGNFVTPFSEDGIRTAQFIREALEMAAVARIAANGLTPEADSALTEALTAQEAAMAASDATAFQAADDAFHAALAEATGLVRVRTLVEREKTALDRLRALRLHDPGHLAALHDDHRQILKALRKGKAERAQRILRTHLAGVLDVLADLKTQHAEYFE
ncbi:GntR family transcriptional regulator [Roseibacterium sp. SDUM158017]|uniref:GntR family transcriptional regulator n=1 Tax=Roseicyclus salinarum TaxID=3036773 RepID=UPI0024159075|nr:GntR family transcriptional regulator [Roseibacterium sp. SDUM158017]MDG4646842.1 GntR family transcriptional regulator [Roseibacterium sp. SDUM158017]